MIVITGGAGFIGSALLWGLNQRGREDVLVVDRLGSGRKWKNLAGRKFRQYIHKDEFLPWLEGRGSGAPLEIVYHLGACTSTTEADVDYLMKNNLEYSCRVFEFCSQRSVPLVYASSAATYGQGEGGYDDDPGKIGGLRPVNPYGYSKQLFDEWALRQEAAPPSWVGLKFFNVYGPQEYHKGPQASVALHAFRQAASGGRVRLFKSHKEGVEDGEQKRDFIYVKDVVSVLIHLLDNRGRAPSGIYNLGTGQARSFRDLAQCVQRSAGRDGAGIEWIDMPDQVKRHYQYYTQASMERMREKLRYTGKFHRLEEGVADYVENYLSRGEGFL